MLNADVTIALTGLNKAKATAGEAGVDSEDEHTFEDNSASRQAYVALDIRVTIRRIVDDMTAPMLPPLLPLSPAELITTTRAVRKRLDLTRPVEREVVLDCAAAAMQAPSGSNQLTMQFVVITDPAKKLAVADIYRECWAVYSKAPIFAGAIKRDTAEHQAQQDRVADSAGYLAEHMHEVPALVLACTSLRGSRDSLPFGSVAAMMGNILPATWNFMLAARARGLGTAWTTLHLMHEQRVAEILDIPYDKVAQTVLFPLAYTIGTDFKPAMRPDPATIVHFDGWTGK